MAEINPVTGQSYGSTSVGQNQQIIRGQKATPAPATPSSRGSLGQTPPAPARPAQPESIRPELPSHWPPGRSPVRPPASYYTPRTYTPPPPIINRTPQPQFRGPGIGAGGGAGGEGGQKLAFGIGGALICGGIGFAIGGPIGALIGGILGFVLGGLLPGLFGGGQGASGTGGAGSPGAATSAEGDGGETQAAPGAPGAAPSSEQMQEGIAQILFGTKPNSGKGTFIDSLTQEDLQKMTQNISEADLQRAFTNPDDLKNGIKDLLSPKISAYKASKNQGSLTPDEQNQISQWAGDLEAGIKNAMAQRGAPG